VDNFSLRDLKRDPNRVRFASRQTTLPDSFDDAALYDWEFRRRRSDVTFYRALAAERIGYNTGGKVLDLACGSGRLLVPMLRDGHTVVGLDRSAPMLERAAARVGRTAAQQKARCMLVRADLRAFNLKPEFEFAVCAFHSVQHLLTNNDLVRFFQRVRRSLRPNGWFAFDVLPAHPDWLARDPERRWSRTMFTHPTTGKRLVYTTNQLYEPRTKVLHIRTYYQPVDKLGRNVGTEYVVGMDSRQLEPDEVASLLERASMKVIARYAAFDLHKHDRNVTFDKKSDEHVYIAKAIG